MLTRRERAFILLYPMIILSSYASYWWYQRRPIAEKKRVYIEYHILLRNMGHWVNMPSSTNEDKSVWQLTTEKNDKTTEAEIRRNSDAVRGS